MFFYKSRRPRWFGTARGLGWLTNPSQGYRNRFHITPSKIKQRLRLYPSQLFYASLRATRRKNGRTKSRRSSLTNINHIDTVINSGYIRHAATKDNHCCKNCKGNNWAVVRRSFLFWNVDMVYCEACKNLDYGLSYEDF